jgi:hypothetical protein
MFFETPQATKPRSLVGHVVHASLSNLESYLPLSNSYIMSVTNINKEFRHLAREHDAFLESNWKFSCEKQDLEAIVSQFKIANEHNSKTIQELEQQSHEVNTMHL